MIRFEFLEAAGVRVAAFTGVDDGDCGLRHEPGRPAALESRRRVAASLEIDGSRVVCAQQVHGDTVAVVMEHDAGRGAIAWEGGIPATDGLITRTRGVPLAILVADCVPVYLADPRKGVVGLVHAGREGTALGIAKTAIDGMRELAGCHPSDILAVIGPSAGPESYEVSEEMADAWRSSGLPAKGRLLDLWEANAGQLVAAGLERSRIHVSGICTMVDRRFYSYRRGDATARNMAVIML